MTDDEKAKRIEALFHGLEIMQMNFERNKENAKGGDE